MAPASPPASPNPQCSNRELVQVDTALAVLKKVNLLEESNALALDIGGSLAKLIYLQPYGARTTAPPLVIHKVDGNIASALSVHVPELKGTLHFFAFETRNIHELLRFVRNYWLRESHNPDDHRLIRATGGGSYKYATTFEDEIGVTLARLDEMSCTVAGLNFLLTSVKNEVYVYVPPATQNGRMSSDDSEVEFAQTTQFVDKNPNPFPYLLVNIGSGVSIVKVTAHDKFERVSGSSLGGGTFWGLARMLLDCATFDDVINLTHHGDNANVDMLVGDIYGGAYASLGLDSSIIAASFGKATMRNDLTRHEQSVWTRLRERLGRAFWGSMELWMSVLDAIPVVGDLVRAMQPVDASLSPPGMVGIRSQFRPQDIALSLLRMVSYNIGQVAYLNARVHNLDRIYFGGNFIRNHPYTLADISFAVDFWSGGKTKALFLRHDGYLGAIGAFIGASSASPTKVFEDQKNKQRKKSRSGPSTPADVPRNGMIRQPTQAEVDNIELNGSAELTPPALNQDDDVKQTKVVSKGQKPSGAKKRKKSKHSSSESIPTSPGQTASHTEDLGKEGTASDGEEEVAGGKPDAEGAWTTVTRVRRRGPNKDKSS